MLMKKRVLSPGSSAFFAVFSDSGLDAAAFLSVSQPSTIKNINVLTAMHVSDTESRCEIKSNLNKEMFISICLFSVKA